MATGFYFQTYEQWREVYGARCGIALTADYARERVAALRNSADRATREFTACYGDAYLRQVIAWFERVIREATT